MKLLDKLRSEINEYGQELAIAMTKLISDSKRLKAGESAFQGLQIGDLWRYELRVTKLREPEAK